MAEPARKLEDDNQKDQPFLRAIPGGGQTTGDRANLRLLNEQESNPEQPNSGSIDEQESNGSNIIQGPWTNNVSGSQNSSKDGSRFSFVKKKGPLLAIILTLVGGGIGISGLLLPGAIFFQLKETLAIFLDNSSPALRIRTNKKMMNAFNSTKNAFAESTDGKCNIKCKMGSINDTMKSNLEAKGFTVDAVEGKGLMKGRWTITSLEFPATDGPPQKITSGKAFSEAMGNPARASSFEKVFNSKTAYFLNSKFGTMLRTKFGLSKVSELTNKLKEKAADKVTSVKDKINESIRETMGYQPIDPNAPKLTAEQTARANTKLKPVFDFVDGPLRTGGKAFDAIGVACVAYNTSKGITYATKAAKIAAYAGFAMMFLNYADKLKAEGGDPEITEQLGNQLTELDSNGKSAMDSLGYRTAAYGDTGVLSADGSSYAITPSSNTVASIGKIAAAIGVGGLVSIGTFRTLCKATNNPVVIAAQACPAEIIAAAATAFETAGIGAVLSGLVCLGKIALITAGLSAAISAAISSLTTSLASSEVPTLDGNTKGEAAGDAIYSGTAQILGGKAASYGLKAGNVAEIKQYAIDTAAVKKQQDQIASYDAKNTPFDINNQYSFLGSLAQKLNLSSFSNSNIIASISNVLAFIPKSLSSLTTNIGAAADTQAALYTNQCNDSNLKSVGVDGDAFCNPSYVMDTNELNSDINTVVDYMTNGNFIDNEVGNAIPGSNYQKYLDNCANRIAPLGETSASIEDDDYEWEVGLNCTNPLTTKIAQEVSYFRTYTMDKAISDTMDQL